MIKRITGIILIFCLLLSTPTLAADSPKPMKTSEAGILFIKHFEGFSSTPYEDGDGYAIGFGTHCNPSDYPDGITVELADSMMRGTLTDMEAYINEMIAKLGLTLSQHEFDALASLTYNIGVSWMNSSYQLYNALSVGIYLRPHDQIVNIFGRYCNYKGEMFVPLAYRRLAEAKLFLYGDYLIGGTQDYTLEFYSDPAAEYPFEFKRIGGLTECRYRDILYWDWYYPYVSPLTFSGVVEGYADGSFRPDGLVTYAEALKMIVLAAGYGEQAKSDIHWASGYLDFALDNGVIDYLKIPKLDDYIDRAAVAEICAKTMGIAASTDNPFSDTDNEYAAALYHAGILTGSVGTDGELLYKSGEYLKRSELCAIVWRATNY